MDLVGFEGNEIDFTKAKVLNFFFLLENDEVERKVGSQTVSSDLGAQALEELMLEYTFNETAAWNEEDALEILPRLIASFGEEIGGSIVSDIPLQGGSYVLIILYVLIMVQFRCN